MYTILELNAWSNFDRLDAILDKGAESGAVGIVLKGSQGTTWTLPNFRDYAERILADGLQLAYLHYCTPGVSEPTDEAAALMSVLTDTPAPFGIWIELDDVAGLSGFNLSEWVKTLAETIHTPLRPVTLFGSPAVLSSLSLLDAKYRRVADHTPDELTIDTYAVLTETTDELAQLGVQGTYLLSHPRGVNPGSPVTLSTPQPAETAPEAPTEPVEAPVEDTPTEPETPTESAPE